MSGASDFLWCAVGRELEVNTVALQPGNSATDPEQDGYEGCEGSWQRCKVEAHKEGVPHTLSQRWLRIVVHCAEAMYSLSVDSDERSALVVDAPIDNGYDEEDDEILSRWLVAPEHLRPWQPFEPPSTLWPEPRFDDFSNGDAVMYVDKNDRSIRWEAHVRRKFGDGVWLYVVGPPAHTWPSDSDHHAACCTSASDHWAATQHNDASYIVSPIARHLRRARTFDPATGQWTRTPPRRAFYDCTWLVHDHVRPRPTSDGGAYCTRQSSVDAKAQVREQLGSRLLAGKRRRSAVDLGSVMAWAGFARERGWEGAGLPGDDGMQDWIVRYLGTCIEEVQQQRRHGAGRGGSLGLREVCKGLESDVDWLHDAAMRFYMHTHHPGAAAEFSWGPAAR